MWVSRFLCSCLMTQSRPTLCSPMDYSLPGSSVHGILQARILEWVAISSSRGASRLGMEPVSPVSPALASSFFTAEPPGKRGQTQAPCIGSVEHLPLDHQGSPKLYLLYFECNLKITVPTNNIMVLVYIYILFYTFQNVIILKQGIVIV